ncbi:syntaxin-16 isoform d [Oopsacas minuta]|uniref:Syntaxin-16 isoform d n=1 Tax=Oopsacas minuta TaxID=111878 RepID=A0AAV7JCT2_9METZ|nr:syntaxin-16 isoform d [Oopsacas minuta]
MEHLQPRVIHRDLTPRFKQWRNIYHSTTHSDDRQDDTIALVIGTTGSDRIRPGSPSSKPPPGWIGALKEVQYNMQRTRDKIRLLKSLHDKHLHQPTISFELGTADQEQEIEIITADITKLFHQSYKNLQLITAYTKQPGSQQEVRLAKNVMHAVASEMQELSTDFKISQSVYLKKRKRREEQAGQLMDSNFSRGGANFADDLNLSTEADIQEDMYVVDKGFTGNQLMLVQKDTQILQHRDKEIQSIVTSLEDISEMFKDMSTMVLDQGTILDRIDYNIESTATKISEAKVQLVKAEKIQKRSRYLYVIIVLTCVLALIVVIFIVLKVLNIGVF